MDTKELLLFLTSLDGTSGDEKEISDAVCTLIDESYTDKLGNVIASYNHNGKIRVMVEAHLDRVGYIVNGIDDNGFLTICKSGSPDLRTSVGAQVTVFGKKAVKGLITSIPPHVQKDNASNEVALNDLTVDVGMNHDEAESIISIGDRVIVKDDPVSLLNSNISASAFDDRAGVASVIIAARNLKNKLNNINLIVALNTREEVGCQGASASAYALDPDIAICVDAGFGKDHNANGVETIELGKGPSIGVAPILDRDLFGCLKKLAVDKGIPFQHDVMSGRTGTDADSISNSKSGVKTALLSIPVRNMHTQAEIVNIDDVEATARLIEEFVLFLEAEND